jgi:hypothetical protein
VSVHEHLGEPPSRTLDLALAASRAGCPVLSLLGDQATGSRRGA